MDLLKESNRILEKLKTEGVHSVDLKNGKEKCYNRPSPVMEVSMDISLKLVVCNLCSQVSLLHQRQRRKKNMNRFFCSHCKRQAQYNEIKIDDPLLAS